MTDVINNPVLDRPAKKLFRLALPMAITQLITMGSSFLCMSMLAHLGREVLAASALIFSISISVLATVISLLFALSILIGHAYGEKQYQTVGSLLQQGWFIAFLISLPSVLLCWHIYPLLIFFGQDPHLSRIVEQFFQASILRVPLILFCIANQQLCYGVNKQKVDMYANIAGVIVLVISAYILIYGKLGLPALGVIGFGYAVVLQAFFYVLISTACLYFGAYFKKFELFRLRLHTNWHALKQLIKIGWPISLQISAEVISFSVFAAFVGWIGTESLAAYQIIMQYQFLIVVPIFSVSQACGILIGQAYGAKQFSEITVLGKAGLIFACGMSFIVAFFFLGLPKCLSSSYIDVHAAGNAAIVKIAISLFAVLALSQLLDGIRNILTGCLRGLLDTGFPMYIGLASMWLIALPLSYFFAFILHWQALGVMIGWTVGVGAGALVLYWRWTKKVLDLKPTETLLETNT
ncbi:MAG TPA: MATE family efflux transporter [Gammaproteobacteria bacterium]|nr:MATE family efflux transporter [Gammaproteobacteria bacterium]